MRDKSPKPGAAAPVTERVEPVRPDQAQLGQSAHDLIAKLERNISQLRSIDPRLEQIYNTCLDLVPGLGIFPIEAQSAEDAPGLRFTTGQFLYLGIEYPMVQLNSAPDSELRALLEVRRVSMELRLERLAFPPQTFDTDLFALRAFTLAHELGHAHDFMRETANIAQHAERPELHYLALESRIREYVLPLGYLTPMHLLEIERKGDAEKFMRQHRGHYGLHGVTSFMELLREAEHTYVQLPSEAAADKFAKAVLDKHPELLQRR